MAVVNSSSLLNQSAPVFPQATTQPELATNSRQNLPKQDFKNNLQRATQDQMNERAAERQKAQVQLKNQANRRALEDRHLDDQARAAANAQQTQQNQLASSDKKIARDKPASHQANKNLVKADETAEHPQPVAKATEERVAELPADVEPSNAFALCSPEDQAAFAESALLAVAEKPDLAGAMEKISKSPEGVGVTETLMAFPVVPLLDGYVAEKTSENLVAVGNVAPVVVPSSVPAATLSPVETPTSELMASAGSDDLLNFLQRVNVKAQSDTWSEQPAGTDAGSDTPMTSTAPGSGIEAVVGASNKNEFKEGAPSVFNLIAAGKNSPETSTENLGAPSKGTPESSPSATTPSAVADAFNSFNQGVRNLAVPTEKITLPMTVAFGHGAWTEALGERTGWLINHKIEQADIQLDPPELGPIAVRIHMQNDQATLTFVSANPAVREAVEQSMGRLKEMLQQQGIALGHADVSSQQQNHQQSENHSDSGHRLNSGLLLDENLQDQAPVTLGVKSLHQIDYFA